MESFNEFQNKYVYKRYVNRLPIYINGRKVSWKKGRLLRPPFGFLADYEGDIDKIRDDAEARGEEYYYIEVENGRIEEAPPRYSYTLFRKLTEEEFEKIFGDMKD